MKMRRFLPLLVFGAMLVPASLAAQDADERIQAALSQAEEAGIPTALLENKVKEGQAKGIPMDRIADAVQRRADGLARAQQALAGTPDVGSDDLSVAADALESGVSEAVLTELANTAPRERRSVAIAALTYLVNADRAPQEALDRVVEALARGPAALENLPAQAHGPPADVGPPDGVPGPGDAPGRGGPGGGPPVDPPVDPPPPGPPGS